MLKVGIRVRGNDRYEGKPIIEQLFKLLKDNKIIGATVYRGIYGYGARGVASMKILGLSLDLPLLIEIIDEHAKLEPILPDIKQIVNDNG
ncbi:MAG: DUF190 domain-containing protein, partial [Candidatus Nitrosothermus koennekii]